MSAQGLVLLCSDLDVDPDRFRLQLEQSAPAAQVAVVERLCRQPDAAAAAVARAGEARVVALCGGDMSAAQVRAACRRGGAEPFGVELVSAVPGSPPGMLALLAAAALAKLQALPQGERGKPALGDHGVSRRALLSPTSTLIQEPVALLDAARCIGAGRCGLCAAACPTAAITCDGGVPEPLRSRCDACGRCVRACPLGAIRIAGSSTAQIEAQLRLLVSGGPRVALACARSPAPPEDGWLRVELPSLGMVSTGWLLQLLAHGARDVRLEPCEGDCCRDWREGGTGLVERLRTLLAAPPTPDPEGLTLIEPEATASALRLLAPAHATAVLEHPSSPLGLLDCDRSSCTLCGACALACPTDALTLEDDDEESVLRHEAGRCVGCGRCAASCPEGSLRVRRGFDLGRARRSGVELQRGERDNLVRGRVERLLANSP